MILQGGPTFRVLTLSIIYIMLSISYKKSTRLSRRIGSPLTDILG